MESEDRTPDKESEPELSQSDSKDSASTSLHFGKSTPLEKIDPSGMVDYIQGDQPGGDKFFQRDR